MAAMAGVWRAQLHELPAPGSGKFGGLKVKSFFLMLKYQQHEIHREKIWYTKVLLFG